MLWIQSYLILAREQISRTLAISLAFFIFLVATPPAALASFGDNAPTAFGSNPFTEQSSSLRVDQPTGALTQSVPISVPPGRNGLQPVLSIDYNSQNTQDSMVGYGWSLSIPYMKRLNKTGTQDLYTNPTFTSSMDGELVSTATSTVYLPRVDTSGQNTYSYSGNTWTVYDKKGTRYTFGSSDSGRQYDTATTSTNTYKWMLQEIRDTNDNYVTYTYAHDGNEIYPVSIVYTGHGVTDGPFSVTFATNARSDVRTTYNTGFKVTLNWRISEIDISTSGTLVGKYVLSYGTGVNGLRSLLTSVQQQGYDESNNLISLPATTFTYASSSTMFIAQSNGSGGSGIGLWGPSYIAADVNGNGINDVTESHYSVDDNPPLAHAQIYLDQGGSSQWNQSASVPEYWSYVNYQFMQWPTESGVRYFDINGDGKVDVVKGNKNDQAGTKTAAESIGNGNETWTSTSTFTGVIPAFSYTTSGGTSLTSGILGDVNGDGLPDFVMALNSYTGDYTYLGNQSAFATSTVFTPVFEMPTGPGTAGNASQLIDINGDGLSDWVYSDSGNTYVRLNTGTGWENSAATQWTIATSTYYSSTLGADTQIYDRGVRFQDVNGDGLPDFIRGYNVAPNTACSGTAPPEYTSFSAAFLNTGNGWATSTAYSTPNIVGGWIGGSSSSPCGAAALNHNEYANWTGNGQMAQDVITNVTYPTGGQKNIIYSPSAQLGTNANLPVSLLVVTTVGEYDGFGGAATTTYAYSGGQIYTAGGAPDRKFAGFSVATTTAPDSVTATYYSQGTGLNTTLGEQTNGYAQIGQPFRKDIFDLSNNLKQRTYYRWDSYTNASSTFLGLGRQLVFDYSTTPSTHRDRATDYFYATTTNDLIKTIEYGEVTGSSDGTFSDYGTDKRTTVLSYVASTSLNVRLPMEKTLFDYSDATTTDERYYYDGLSLGSVGKGNKTKTEKWQTGTTYVNDQKAYNTYGLVASSTDPRGNVTTYSYDSFNLYIATSTNPLSQTTQFYYDYTLGKPKETIDPNGLHFQTVYDGLDRPITQTQPDLTTPSTLVTKRTYAYTDTIGSRNILETNYLDASNNFTLYTYLDGLDRVIQTRKEDGVSNQFSVKDSAYNSAGLLKQESLPYFSSGSSFTTATTTQSLYTQYTYDALKRMLTSANAVGTTTKSYDRWDTTVTDPLNKVKTYSTEAFGNVARVDENITTSTYSTYYEYTPLASLTKITDAQGNIRNFTYDGLNRQVTAQDLHSSADTTFGTTTYAYDSANNLTQKVDPNGKTTTYTYDALNRKLTEGTNGGGGNTVTVFLTLNPGQGNQTWTVPADWNNASNSVAVIGSGGSGGVSNANGGGGGGGGAFASSTNLTLSGTVTYAIGTSATTTSPTLSQSAFYETYFNGTASSTASVVADWGRMGNSTAGGAGGSTSYSIGSTKFAGGNGGAPGGATNEGGGGGGGAAGPHGAGPNAPSNAGHSSGGGGSGNGGGSAGAAGGGGSNSGGNNYLASGGGTANGGAGSNGGGGGGANSGASSVSGGAGSTGSEWATGTGSGGGGGGAAPSSSSSNGGVGGIYGGGGGGGQFTGQGAGGGGGQGLIVITYVSTATNAATYTYDTCTNGIGHLCGWVNTSASSTTQYDSNGNVKQETRTVGGNNYTMSYVYDRQGNIATTTYPDNSIVQNIYNNAGQLNIVQQKESGASSFTNVIAHTDYSPMGQVTYRKWGNGAETWDTYDPTKLYRLINILTINN